MTARGARLSDLLRAAGIHRPVSGEGDPVILGACLDSRRARPGDVFFAIRGFESDGLDYVPQALCNGARAVIAATPRPQGLAPDVAWVEVEHSRRAAALVSREIFARPDEALVLVGITGTNGKTTVAHLVQSMAVAAGMHAGRIGTDGYGYGEVRATAERTTPEAPDLYRLLAAMRDDDVALVAMEVSSHALSLHRVVGARFATAAFLNLERDHLDFHGDREAYFQAKAALFESLGPEQHAVLPAESPWTARLCRMTRAGVLTFGRSPAAQVRLRDGRCDLDGLTARLETPCGQWMLRSPLLGDFSLDNVAAAAACALAVGLSATAVVEGAARLERVPGRMDRVDCGQPFAVIVDYAHTEDALRRLLEWTRAAAEGRVHVVFGCGGDRDRGKRPDMGRAAAELAHGIHLTSDNPRGEDPREILEEIAGGVRSVPGAGERCRIEVDRRAAIFGAVAEADDGDVVIIAGKGHEATQTIGRRSAAFDDRLVAIEALEARGFRGGSHARA